MYNQMDIKYDLTFFSFKLHSNLQFHIHIPVVYCGTSIHLYDITKKYYEHLDQFSRWAPVLLPKTSKTLFGPVHFPVFFLKELYKNKFKNLIWTSKFKFSFRGLLEQYEVWPNRKSYHNAPQLILCQQLIKRSISLWNMTSLVTNFTISYQNQTY
jgi:hypothetical protein